MNPELVVTPKGEQRIRNGHPWVFRSDIEKAPSKSEIVPGQIVSILSRKKQFLGQGFYNPLSQISLRLVTRGREEIDRNFWRQRILDSVARRHHLRERDCLRLVYGECDQMPSFIVDRYQDIVVFQTLSAGADRFRDIYIDLLDELFQPKGIVERNDPQVRELEGLVRQKGIVRGSVPSPLVVLEGTKDQGRLISIDPLEGQKTGFFLDQVDNHTMAAHYAHGRALDLFTYQGGFALAIAPFCDEVTAVDSSGGALQQLRANLDRNSITNVLPYEENAFDYLRHCEKQEERFDMIILDPPPFVRDRKNLTGALRGYKEINLRAMKLLNPGGILITCSCSQNFTSELFQQTLHEASRDTRRTLQVLERRGPSSDHPVLLSFPESNYLQCWILRVL